MSEPISTPPWDLAAGNRWTIQSEDHRIANDRGNETVVDARGNVVAYVSGNNDEGGNGALLSAAPALAEACKLIVECSKYWANAFSGERKALDLRSRRAEAGWPAMRRYSYAPGDAYDQSPDTDPAPVPCASCGRLEPCDCGTEPDRDDAREAEAANE